MEYCLTELQGHTKSKIFIIQVLVGLPQVIKIFYLYNTVCDYVKGFANHDKITLSTAVLNLLRVSMRYIFKRASLDQRGNDYFTQMLSMLGNCKLFISSYDFFLLLLQGNLIKLMGWEGGFCFVGVFFDCLGLFIWFGFLLFGWLGLVFFCCRCCYCCWLGFVGDLGFFFI